jgi:hypothetical protein
MKMPLIKKFDTKTLVYILLLVFFGFFICLSLPKVLKINEGMENMADGNAGAPAPLAQTFSF